MTDRLAAPSVGAAALPSGWWAPALHLAERSAWPAPSVLLLQRPLLVRS